MQKENDTELQIFEEVTVEELNTNFGKLIWKALLQPVIL
ncbi:hypothetical protein SRA_09808 [Streptococcus ratti FA-1 = DSM 20564]|uniref:Uncharacterized protein n=1 Tax=Streptococcus ratti FA-1 = DSM 20564 TaxID=699248 RepID=A0ABN0GSN3_STRRT|nr:hypothetical protein SRA_09808 [Streptococcus ratti FA-1 = DSM 20564]